MLSFDPVNFICMIINILILYFIAKKFLFGRVDAVIKKRQEELDTAYNAADKVTKEAQDTKHEYQMQLAEFEKERSEKMDEAVKEAEAKSNAIIDDANAEAASILSNAKNEADRIRSMAEIDHDKQVEELVFDVAARLAGQAISEEANSELYDRFLSQATGSNTTGKE